VLTLTAPVSRKGPPLYLCASLRDLTERRDLEARMLHVAAHDGLTGLFNRRRFEEEIERELAQARRYGTRGALLFLDLDSFKSVNDRLGHRAGDALLMRVASLLRKHLRESDIVARLNGDEFAALLPQADTDAAQTVANRLLDSIRRNALAVAGQQAQTTVSIGIALFPEQGATPEDLLVNAERAMRHVKNNGRDGCWVYRVEGETATTVRNERDWERTIREALATDRFVAYAQPILDLSAGAISQYELLIRLIGDNGEVILPNSFLGVAERTGLIHAIDRWMVKRAIQMIADERRQGRELKVEVNLSGTAFTDRELLPMIQYELLRTHINPACLTLEITETAAIADLDQARQFISSLRGWGCRFALDDFGVGFSSFTYLKHLPVDFVKLDGSFIRNLPNDAADQHLVRAMVEVARSLGKQTIAEFVGDEATVKLLRTLGVDYAQGYYIGRPAPMEEPATPGRRTAARVA
jgi:diguanylate cyclase (GGDEF)-like protein